VKRVYEGAPYHTRTGTATKSPAPIDGPGALRNSCKISESGTSLNRIGTSSGQFVRLNFTQAATIAEVLVEKYHGFVVTWGEMDPKIRSALIKNGLATESGKIIKNNMIKKTAIKLPIDSAHHLTVEFLGNTRDLYLLDWITIAYYKGKKKYLLYNFWWVLGEIPTFECLLMRAINNQLTLHESITQDIGFLWNEYLKDKKGYNFVEISEEESGEVSTFWVGQRHHLFGSKKWTTWFYNKSGDIYLEITPCYRWHYLKPKKNEKFVRYKDFIKKYKPLVIIKLDKKVAQKWLKIVSKLLVIARRNYEKARKEDARRKQEQQELEQKVSHEKNGN
jgi:hypothetical protein